MVRIANVGFELNSTSLEPPGAGTTGSPTITTTYVRSGRYGMECPASTSADRGFDNFRVVTANTNVLYVRAYLYIAVYPGNSTRDIVRLKDSGSVVRSKIRMTTSGALQLFNNSAQVGSDSAVLGKDRWYLIELYFDNSGGAGAGILDARINGASFASSTTQSLTSGVYHLDCLIQSDAASAVGHIIFDDIGVNDSTGSFQNSWLGGGQMIYLRPNATGSSTQWTNTYANVDEITPNDATDLIASNTANQISNFNIDSPIALNDQDTINLVALGVRFRIDSAIGADPTFVVRITAGGNTEESGTISPTSTTWFTNATATPSTYPLTLYDLPGGSTTPFTKNDLETTEIGVKETLTDTHNVNVTALWLVVDYTPNAIRKWGVKP